MKRVEPPSVREVWTLAEQIRMGWSFRERQKRDRRPRRRKPVYRLADIMAAKRDLEQEDDR